MKNKKLIFPLITLAAILLFLVTSPFETKDSPSPLANLTHQKKTPHSSNNSSRSIASQSNTNMKIKSANTKAYLNGRELIGSKDNLHDIVFINKVNTNWKQIYTGNFKRMLYDKKPQNFKVKLKRSIIKLKEHTAQNLEHVLVSYTKPNGHPFSFEAMIDSETGSLIRTWNKTRYEFKKPLQVKAYILQRKKIK